MGLSNSFWSDFTDATARKCMATRAKNKCGFPLLQFINYLGTFFFLYRKDLKPYWLPDWGPCCFLWQYLLGSWEMRREKDMENKPHVQVKCQCKHHASPAQTCQPN